MLREQGGDGDRYCEDGDMYCGNGWGWGQFTVPVQLSSQECTILLVRTCSTSLTLSEILHRLSENSD